MKIITKNDLLEMPPGTVYTTFKPNMVDGDLHIKVSNDCNLNLIPSFDFSDDKLRKTNWSTDDTHILVDYDDNQKFAIFSRAEIMKMINCLSWALCGCVAQFNMDEVYIDEFMNYDPDGIRLMKER